MVCDDDLPARRWPQGPAGAHRPATRVDDRRLRDRGHPRGVHRPAHRRVPGPGRHHAAPGAAAGVRPGGGGAGRRLGHGGGRQGRRRRPGRHPPGASSGRRCGTAPRAPAWSSVPVPASARSPCPGCRWTSASRRSTRCRAQMMRGVVEALAAGARRRRRRRGGDLGGPRRGDRPAHLEPAARHPRRPVDPRHDRGRRPLLVLGVDRQHSQGDRRRARPSASPTSRPAPGRPRSRSRCASTAWPRARCWTWATSPGRC